MVNNRPANISPGHLKSLATLLWHNARNLPAALLFWLQIRRLLTTLDEMFTCWRNAPPQPIQPTPIPAPPERPRVPTAAPRPKSVRRPAPCRALAAPAVEPRVRPRTPRPPPCAARHAPHASPRPQPSPPPAQSHFLYTPPPMPNRVHIVPLKQLIAATLARCVAP